MGRIVYKKDSTFLHYAVDVAYKFEAWIFSSSADDLMGEVVNEDKNSCVDATASSWEMLVDSDWQQDETARGTGHISRRPSQQWGVPGVCEGQQTPLLPQGST